LIGQLEQRETSAVRLVPSLCTSEVRPRAAGKFIYLGEDKLSVHGVTYGTFEPDADGGQFPAPRLVARDFAQMAAHGINAVRVYTVPPRWLLDCAQRHGLYVMVGLPWEQHVSFLDDRQRVRSIEERIRAGVRACAAHPALLGFAIGNEIPTSIVRWYGRRRTEHFLKRLYRIAKSEDPQALVSYVNYPSTEYLRLPFVDFVCCNVYLEERERFESYIAHLHNIAGDRPLVLGEIGFDSQRHGLDGQAQTLDWQVRVALASGCAGAFVFAWTDQWYRGQAILDWDFGLTDRLRRPKPALAAIQKAFAQTLVSEGPAWPRVSVVICSYNGARVIRDCCAGLRELDYPNYEVIVVDDGSTDGTGDIARSYGFRVIATPNQGLSIARNVGMKAATGEIVAYLDDDARPDPQWLTYLASTFMSTDYAGVGGPNIPPAGDGLIADCVAHAPGGPIHVLLSDREAEHIPGCNMAFRKACLEAIGGFDPRFRVAGDDVDVCWRLQEQGKKLGFHPAAVVWHHRRNSFRAYWRQQRGYGRAEALLERKWPEKYNGAGHVTWNGRLYGLGLVYSLRWRRERIAYGVWGSAAFQPALPTSPGLLSTLPLMPEWHLLSGVLGVLSLMAIQWSLLLWFLPIFVLTVAASLLQALLSAAHAPFTGIEGSRAYRVKLRALTAYTHLLHAMARLAGRRWSRKWPGGLRRSGIALPHPRTVTIWSEHWQCPEAWLRAVEADLRAGGAAILRGGEFDRWDLEVRGGSLGGSRLRMASEEHGEGRQLIRFCVWPRCSRFGVALLICLAMLFGVAMHDRSWMASLVLGNWVIALLLTITWRCASTHEAALRALRLVEWAVEQLP
jgi:GT2 family glycosyltransferase